MQTWMLKKPASSKNIRKSTRILMLKEVLRATTVKRKKMVMLECMVDRRSNVRNNDTKL